MNESTEGQAIRPGAGEVGDLDILILPGPALAPDEDGLHLWGHADLTLCPSFMDRPASLTSTDHSRYLC